MCGEEKRSLRAVRATSKTRHTLQEEYEILIKVVHLRIGFLKLQWWELHCSQHCHLTSGLPTTPRRANSHFLSKWHWIRYFVFAPSEVQQWKSIDFKYPYRSWFPSVEPKLCFFFFFLVSFYFNDFTCFSAVLLSTAYSTFYIVGLILSMQVPFVGFQPIRTSEHMAAAGKSHPLYLQYEWSSIQPGATGSPLQSSSHLMMKSAVFGRYCCSLFQIYDSLINRCHKYMNVKAYFSLSYLKQEQAVICANSWSNQYVYIDWTNVQTVPFNSDKTLQLLCALNFNRVVWRPTLCEMWLNKIIEQYISQDLAHHMDALQKL